MSGPAVPVHCKCGWVGFRIPTKIKARPCPNCDGEVTRWRDLQDAVAKSEEIKRRTLETRLANIERRQLDIEDEIAARNEPVPRLPNPYCMQIGTGGVQIFRIPAHCLRRTPIRRRR